MEKQQILTYEQAVDYINGIPRFSKKNTMADTRAFLARLGHPDKELRIIHVAGTNGKGSVCAYIRSILETAGYRTAVFTSPHLVDIRERFVTAGEMVSKELFLQVFLRVYETLDWAALSAGQGYHPSFFEYLFFMAMILFAEQKPDYCILETGLGGRLDATNAVSHKLMAVITRISLDHVEYLGDTVAAISEEKAGIMERGVPTVYADVDPDATAVFCRKAAQLGSPLHSVSKKDYSFLKFNNKYIDFSYISRYYESVELHLHTIAAYQMENCALAVRAVEVLKEADEISLEAIRQGVEACSWPGRMEEILPEVYVDGAHNEDGVRAFLETVAADGFSGHRSLLFGAVQDKDFAGMLRRIVCSRLFGRIGIARLKSGRTASLEDMRQALDEYPAVEVTEYPDACGAFEALCGSRMQEERLYIAGSLYLVGEIKEYIEK